MMIALLGYGVVGSNVYKLCTDNKNLKISGVFCRHPEKVPNGLGTTDGKALVSSPEVDTVVELLGGLHPSYELVSDALKAGKNVVSANKFLICHYYKELMHLAKENKVALRCTAAVGGGIPFLTSLARVKRVDKIDKVSGIMNGTTNFILCMMHHQGASFEEALTNAQQLGYAEKDPTDDIEGYDVARKLAISASVAFDARVSEEQILVCGISRIKEEDIVAFQAHQLTCKLIAGAGIIPGNGIYATVEPTLCTTSSLEASVKENYNLISFDGPVYGRQSFFGQGAGGNPTAANVIQDLNDILLGAKGFYTENINEKKIVNDCIFRRYYVRTNHSIQLPTESVWPEGGFITKPMQASIIHRLSKETDDLFFAALQ